MKFGVLALDFDGTIAHEGRVDAGVRSAIEDVRGNGIAIVLVTGRILDDLRCVAGDLSFAEAVVAENGAVVALRGATPRLLCPEASPALTRALEHGRIRFQAGRCVVEADAGDALRILTLIRSLELPLALAFNRGRVMVLPQGVCKSTGLRQALRALRLSSHNALAIGDAENDHDLLYECEVGAAVAWGSEALRATADVVVPGRGPPDVAAFLRGSLRSMTLPPTHNVRRKVTLGRVRGNRPVELPVRGRNLLVAGDPRSGKSWAVGLVCEQLVMLGYSLCIVDPEGDYTPLEALPGVVAFGGAYPLPPPPEVVRALRHPDLSVVIDLSRLEQPAKETYLRDLLPALTRFRRATGLPHRIVIDEAHYFLNRPDARDFVDFELGEYALVTYRVSDLHPDVIATAQAVIMTHTSDPREVAVLARIAGIEEDTRLQDIVGELAIDEAVLVAADDGDGEARIRRFTLSPRLTSHVRHRAKYRDVPVAAERAFVFTSGGRQWGTAARTLRAFIEGIACAPGGALRDHARRGDFSRWVADVFGDRPLAEDLAEVERRVQAGEVPDPRSALAASISERYEVA